MHAKGSAPHDIFLARAEIGLYTTLHRLKARVRTSAILRRLLTGRVAPAVSASQRHHLD